MYTPNLSEFPDFSLERLLVTCFGHTPSARLKTCILIDLPDLSLMVGHRFLGENGFEVQKCSHDVFLKLLKEGVSERMGYSSNDFFAFKTTGGSNLDPEDELIDSEGNSLTFTEDICPKYDLILAITDFSLTAPLTAMAKEHGFRGATLHGVNEVILKSGLSVDYEMVSRQAELFRSVLNKADAFELDFESLGREFTLRIECDAQEAQKSHGLCPPGKPGGESSRGRSLFRTQRRYGFVSVPLFGWNLGQHEGFRGGNRRCRIYAWGRGVGERKKSKAQARSRNRHYRRTWLRYPVASFSGKDIQDEKILATCHVATGRSDHLGGSLTPELFNSRENASHDDILYAPPKLRKSSFLK